MCIATLKRGVFICLLTSLVAVSSSQAQETNPVAYWSFDRAQFFFGISPQGYLGFHAGAGGWKICRSENKIPLRTWKHVAASFDGQAMIVIWIELEATEPTEFAISGAAPAGDYSIPAALKKPKVTEIRKRAPW